MIKKVLKSIEKYFIRRYMERSLEYLVGDLKDVLLVIVEQLDKKPYTNAQKFEEAKKALEALLKEKSRQLTKRQINLAVELAVNIFHEALERIAK
jgi:flavodoxin